MKSEAVVWRCFVKKGVLRNFAKFTGKHLCKRLFFYCFFFQSKSPICFNISMKEKNCCNSELVKWYKVKWVKTQSILWDFSMLFVTLDSKGEFCSTFPEDWCLMDLWRLWHALEMWYTHFCILAPYSKNWLFLTELLFSQQHFLLLVIVLRTCPYMLSWDGANHTYEFRISEASSINHVVKSSEQLWRQLTINSTSQIAFLVSESTVQA